MSENRPPENPQGTPSPGQPTPAPQPPPQPPVSPQLIALAAAQLIGGAAARAPLPFGIGIPVAGLPVAQQTFQVWQGQYPPPDAVEHYEKVLSGSFDRMIAMAERLQAAQIEESRRAHDYAQRDSQRGHWLGFSTAIGAMVAASVALVLGYPWVAGVFISVPVMGVAKALVDSVKRSSPSELIKAAATQPMPTASPAAAPAGSPAPT
jgi:uncharacterized membrane protein